MTLIPTLATARIETEVDAERAAREIVGTPLTEIRAGLILDPISRDPVHALDGPSLGDWIPDVGLSPGGTMALERAWRANKRPDGGFDVAAIDREVIQVDGKPKTAISQLSRLKRLALLEYVGALEAGHPLAIQPVSPALPEDPIWAVGSFARLSQGVTPIQLGISDAMAGPMGLAPGQPIDLRPMALSWMWVGWSLDPSLLHISMDRKAQSGQYLAKEFWDAGPYPWHAAYFAARHPIEEQRASGACFQPEINAFVNESALSRLAPKGDAGYVRFCANLLRMDCLLMTRDLKKGMVLRNPESARQQMTALWDFVRPQYDRRSVDSTSRIYAEAMRLAVRHS